MSNEKNIADRLPPDQQSNEPGLSTAPPATPSSPTGHSSSPPSGSTPSRPAPPTAIEWVPVADLVREAYPVPAEPIQMPQGDGKDADDPDRIAALADRIRQTGRFDPIHIDEANKIMDGRRRHAAAVLLGQERVPCLRYTGLTEAQKWEHAWTQGARREFAKLPKQQRLELTRQALLRLHRYSDAYIAGLVPESERTIAERRAAMVEAQEIPEHPRLMGLDGKTYPVKSRVQKAAEAAAERAEYERQQAEFAARREANARATEDAIRAAKKAEEKLPLEQRAEREAKEREEREQQERLRDAEYLRKEILNKEEPLVVEVSADLGPLPRGRYLIRYSTGYDNQRVGRALRRAGYSGIIDIYPGPQPKPPADAPPPEVPPNPPADAPQPPAPEPAQEPPVAEQEPPPADRAAGRSGKKTRK